MWLISLLVLSPALARKGAAPRPDPDDSQVMVVQAVVPVSGGVVVVLTDEPRQQLIQIGVGESEGLTIALRHDRRAFGRPLTHDLLDQFLLHAKARVVEVRIDDYVQETFVARVTLETRRRQEHTLDARASDAIALALGHDLPIFVADRVVEAVAFDPDVLEAPEPSSDDPHEAL